jgi:hypothetical protein
MRQRINANILELSKPANLIQVEPSEPDFHKYFVSEGISPRTQSTSGLTENVSRDPDQILKFVYAYNRKTSSYMISQYMSNNSLVHSVAGMVCAMDVCYAMNIIIVFMSKISRY